MLFIKIKDFLRSEDGGEGSQTAILIAVASVVMLGLITYVGFKIKPVVETGGTTIDHGGAWEYGDEPKTK